MFFVCSILILYLCSFCTSNIIQKPLLQTSVGNDLYITCEHDALVGTAYIHWYRLSAGHRPVFLIGDFKDHETTDKRFKLIFGDGKKSNVLLIRDIRFEDNAVYLCAKSEATGLNRLTFGKGTMLTVVPKTQQKTPSVYKLESSKKVENLPDSVCLITDFPSPNKTLTIDGKEVNLNDEAVLDNSTDNVWRYSTVIWDNKTDVNCNGKYDDNEFDGESDTGNTEETCSSSVSIDKNFQTNPSLNTISVTVLGLRVLTAKAIVFNLIITARLWSS